MRRSLHTLPVAMVLLAVVLIVLAVAYGSFTFAAVALAVFAGLMVLLIVFSLPSFRYKQKVKYDHSFLTNLFGGTSRPYRGPGAKDDE